MEQTINYIRNILREEGISGMDSINHCIMFIVARTLNEELCNKLKIDSKFSYDNLMKNKNGDGVVGSQELYEKLYNKTNQNACLIGQIMMKIFKSFKFKMSCAKNVTNIMKKLKTFDPSNLALKYDIIGTIYELHLKSGSTNAMRDLGQYYTNRQIISYMIKLCDPVMEDDENIETILDPTMGTGGFLTMAIKHYNAKYDNIDWAKNKNNIIGFDIDGNVKDMAVLNVMLESGEVCDETLIKDNTLYNDFKFGNGNRLQKAKIILANEPMGLTNIIHANCCDRIKDLKIRGTKAEPLFLQLFMQTLDEGGRCAVIVPDGVLFNVAKLHVETRKYLIENFNLKKVMSMNDKLFLNTDVRVSILFFVNDGNKTNEVEFGDIKLIDDNVKETNIIKVKYDDIKTTEYSLHAPKYKMGNDKFKDVEYKKLNDICIFLPTTKHTSSKGNDTGKYRFYNSSQTNKLYLDTYEVNKDSIIIGNGGRISVHYDTQFTPSKHVTVCQVKNNEIHESKYIYYYLLTNVAKLESLGAGSTILWLNKTNIGNFEIPIPPINIQKQIIQKMDKLVENTQTYNMRIKTTKDKIKTIIMNPNTKNQ